MRVCTRHQPHQLPRHGAGPFAHRRDTVTPASSAMPVRVLIGDTVLTGHLFDNATAKDLASQLPLTLTFRDLNGQEKISPLPRKLSVDGMPPGDDPHVGDLGYWAPDGNLVLYYGDVSYGTGIMRIGEFDGDMQAVAQHAATSARPLNSPGRRSRTRRCKPSAN